MAGAVQAGCVVGLMKRIAVITALAVALSGCMIGKGKNKSGAYAVNGLIMGTGLLLTGGDAFSASLGISLLISGGIGMLATAASSSEASSGKTTLGGEDDLDSRDEPVGRLPGRRAQPVASRGCDAWKQAIDNASSEGTRKTLLRHLPPECLRYMAEPYAVTPPVALPKPQPQPQPLPQPLPQPQPVPNPGTATPGPGTLTPAECDRRWAAVDAETDLARRGTLEAAIPPECR